MLADRPAAQSGVEWEERDRGANHNPAWEVACVSEELIGEFSSRSRAIEIETNRRVSDQIAVHRTRPSSTRIIRLRAQARMSTRPEEQIRALAD